MTVDVDDLLQVAEWAEQYGSNMPDDYRASLRRVFLAIDAVHPPSGQSDCTGCGGQGVVWGVTDSDLEPCLNCGED
ncbi:MAG TPA: hypothetical protein VHC63_13445 [Acidimicrobiales bacterium]|nr:hypothetical protein [Acidimicrobiales bacterium]